MQQIPSKTYLFSTPKPTAKFAPELYFTGNRNTTDESDSGDESLSPDSPLLPEGQETTSKISKLSIDFELFFDILENRESHFPFEELSNGDSWFYFDEEGVEYGPFSAQTMNSLFHEDRLSDLLKFRRSDEDRHVTFDQMLKRYYKRRNPQKITAQPTRQRPTQPVRLQRDKNDVIDTFGSRFKARDARIFSDQVRPTFSFGLKPNEGSTEEEASDGEEVLETRCRSVTMA